MSGPVKDRNCATEISIKVNEKQRGAYFSFLSIKSLQPLSILLPFLFDAFQYYRLQQVNKVQDTRPVLISESHVD